MSGLVLVLNSGSSSLKYQLLDPESRQVTADGTIEQIGEPQSSLKHSAGPDWSMGGGKPVPDHAAALKLMEQQLADSGIELATVGITAVGHRVVHGGPAFTDPVIIDDDVITRLEQVSALAPLHNPPAIACIEAARRKLPDVPHVAVFDTAFFATLPAAAHTYAIPADLARDHQIRKYGFHGTSHHYVAQTVAQILGRERLNQIIFHLGNGCSASAIRDGVAVETSMGLTPLQGLVMGTRSGDVDPGLHAYLHSQLDLSLPEIDDLLNKQSGLKGLAGVNDFRELDKLRSAGDRRAQLAFEVYVHRIKLYLGGYWAVLGGVDVVTFTGGVGENSPAVRAAALAGLEGLGIRIDAELNTAEDDRPRVISTPASAVVVMVVPTSEELAIARATADLTG